MLQIRPYLATTMLLAALCGAAAGQTPAAETRAVPALASAFSEIDRLFTDYAANAHVPGMAWGIVVDGALVHMGTFGVQDTTSKTPVTPDTVFRIASMTKSFTALSILKLRDDGKLSLDDPAERYVPELRALSYPTSDSPRLTIRHLLSHSEGFPEDNPWGDQQLNRTDDEMAAMMTNGIPFSNPPGIDTDTQRDSLDTIRRMNELRLGAVGDPEIATRIIPAVLGVSRAGSIEPSASVCELRMVRLVGLTY